MALRDLMIKFCVNIMQFVIKVNKIGGISYRFPPLFSCLYGRMWLKGLERI